MKEITPAQHLGAYLRTARHQQHLTTRQLAEKSGVNFATISRIEQGKFTAPSPAVLKAIARALYLPLADVYALADYLEPSQLPTFPHYLRIRYGDLPPRSLAALEAHFANLASNPDVSLAGPEAGDDEQPHHKSATGR